MSAVELNRPTTSQVALIESLTKRELVVLLRLSEDVTLEVMAAELWVSRNTVKSQVRSLYRKLGVSTRAAAVAWAEDAGLRKLH